MGTRVTVLPTQPQIYYIVMMTKSETLLYCYHCQFEFQKNIKFNTVTTIEVFKFCRLHGEKNKKLFFFL